MPEAGFQKCSLVAAHHTRHTLRQRALTALPSPQAMLSLAGFPEWPEVMTSWGNKMLAAVHTVAHMAAIGFGLPPGTFTERMVQGPHLLAPTGTALQALWHTSQSIIGN